MDRESLERLATALGTMAITHSLGFYHVYACRPRHAPALAYPIEPDPHERIDFGLRDFRCPCGQAAQIQAPDYRGADCVLCPRCGWWHSVYFTGPRGDREEVEDFNIEVALAEELGEDFRDAGLRIAIEHAIRKDGLPPLSGSA